MSWTYQIIFIRLTQVTRGKKKPKAKAIRENRSTSKALVLDALGRGFDFEDVDIAAPMGREVLINVQASGLCRTDLLFATHDIVPTRAVPGHEVAGIVAAVGPDVAHRL
jgi:D-arabinose 1-dehydrogenase-like Zn-dependent alcohol dehydrogenase